MEQKFKKSTDETKQEPERQRAWDHWDGNFGLDGLYLYRAVHFLA